MSQWLTMRLVSANRDAETLASACGKLLAARECPECVNDQCAQAFDAACECVCHDLVQMARVGARRALHAHAFRRAMGSGA